MDIKPLEKQILDVIFYSAPEQIKDKISYLLKEHEDSVNKMLIDNKGLHEKTIMNSTIKMLVDLQKKNEALLDEVKQNLIGNAMESQLYFYQDLVNEKKKINDD